MKESSTERHKGLGFFMKELKAGSGEGEAKKVTLAQVLNSVRVPLTYKLALEMGDEDAKVQELVRFPPAWLFPLLALVLMAARFLVRR